MFIPPNYLEILSVAFEVSGISRGAARNDKLGFKEHSSIKRHQEAYEYTSKLIVESLSASAPLALYDYLSSLQRFINELNSPAYETKLCQKEGSIVYWENVFSPMLATLLYKFCDEKFEGNALHFLNKFLLQSLGRGEKQKVRSCSSSTNSSKAKWAKDAIKAQNQYSTPKFTARINDIRETSVRGLTSIKNDILLLKEDLYKLQSEEDISDLEIEKHIAKVKSAYIAAMLIRRLENAGLNKHLKLVSQSLGDLQNDNKNVGGLLKLHQEICNALLHGDSLFNIWQTAEGSKLIFQLDDYLIPEISCNYPEVIDIISRDGSDFCWPKTSKLKQVILEYNFISSLEAHQKTLLEAVLIDYYSMYLYTEERNFEKALELCLKVEKAAEKVHLGSFLAANLVHKIALHWHINETMKHNQFSSELAQIIIHIPDETKFEIQLNTVFINFRNSMSAEEMMMLEVFRIFNLHHSSVAVNPLKYLSTAINSALRVCSNNSKTIEELLPLYRKNADTKYKRTLSVLSFVNLTLTQSVDMLPELYELIGISVHTEVDQEIINKDDREKYKELIKAYDKELIEKQNKSNII